MPSESTNDLKTGSAASEDALGAALAQSRGDVTAGRYVVESAQQHMERLEALLARDL